MKKILAALLVALLLLPCAAGADATERRGLVEFIELYASRLMEYQKDREEDYKVPFGVNVPPEIKEDYILVETAAGSIAVDKDDLTILHIVSALSFLPKGKTDEKAKNEANYFYAVNCISVISALEHGAEDARVLESLEISAMDDALWTMQKEILPKSKDSFPREIPGERIAKVYTGNYDYSVLCENTNEFRAMYLVAKARKED